MDMFVVGGAVRDVMLGKDPKDIDYVVVGATPEQMLSNGFEQVGKAFPVFLKDGNEYALARTERKNGQGYTGFDVDFNDSVTLLEDLQRRDFTINAMAVHVDNWGKFCKEPINTRLQYLIDPFNGMDDLVERRLWPVSSETFTDDPLRILRGARFAAEYRMRWDDYIQSLATKVVRSGELDHISDERKGVEIEKTIARVQTIADVRKFKQILDSLKVLVFKMNTVNVLYIPSVRHITKSAPSIIRLAALFEGIDESDLNEVQSRFRLSNDTMVRLQMYRIFNQMLNIMVSGEFDCDELTKLAMKLIEKSTRSFNDNHSTLLKMVKDAALYLNDDTCDRAVSLINETIRVFQVIKFDTIDIPEMLEGRQIAAFIADQRGSHVYDLVNGLNKTNTTI